VYIPVPLPRPTVHLPRPTVHLPRPTVHLPRPTANLATLLATKLRLYPIPMEPSRQGQGQQGGIRSTYSDPVSTYSAPVSTYSAPVSTYSAPAYTPSYSAPVSSYSATRPYRWQLPCRGQLLWIWILIRPRSTKPGVLKTVFPNTRACKLGRCRAQRGIRGPTSTQCRPASSPRGQGRRLRVLFQLPRACYSLLGGCAADVPHRASWATSIPAGLRTESPLGPLLQHSP
jgi:hypothetical protein